MAKQEHLTEKPAQLGTFKVLYPNITTRHSKTPFIISEMIIKRFISFMIFHLTSNANSEKKAGLLPKGQASEAGAFQRQQCNWQKR